MRALLIIELKPVSKYFMGLAACFHLPPIEVLPFDCPPPREKFDHYVIHPVAFNIVEKMLCSWVVCLVHFQCFGIVIDRNVRITAQGKSESFLRSATTGKEINNKAVNAAIYGED